MAQITIYIKDELEKAIKACAEKEHKSVSAFITETLAFKIEHQGWTQEFLDLAGSMPDLKTPEDFPPEPVE